MNGNNGRTPGGLPGNEFVDSTGMGPGGTPMFNPNADTSRSGLDAGLPDHQVPVTNAYQFGTAMVPFTAVPFNTWQAWARLGIYGAVAMATWKHAKPVAYVALGAAAISAMTSMANGGGNG